MVETQSASREIVSVRSRHLHGGGLLPSADALDAIVAGCATALTAGGPGWAIAQFDHAVHWAVLDERALLWPPGVRPEDCDPAYLDDLRLFGAGGELHLWRAAGGLAWRLALDGDAIDLDVGTLGVGVEHDATAERRTLDDFQYLWGVRLADVPDAPDWLDVIESAAAEEGGRGIRMRVPVAALARRDLPLRLSVRLYLHADDSGMVDIDDWRLTGLLPRALSAESGGAS